MEMLIEYFKVSESDFEKTRKELMKKLFHIDLITHHNDGTVTFRASRPKSDFMARLPMMHALLIPYRYI